MELLRPRGTVVATRGWLVLGLVASTGCLTWNSHIEGRLGLVMLDDVPVPEGVIHEEEGVKDLGSDGGGALLFINFEAIETEAVMESMEDITLAPDTYLEGHVRHWFFPFLAGFFEGTTFEARLMRMKVKPLPEVHTEAAVDSLD